MLRHELRLMAVALQYFTRLPMPRLHGFAANWLSEAVRYFPLAGLIVGALTALTLQLVALALPWPIACAIALAASMCITGAFHEDGLADTFDALGGAVARERALEIMRDSRIGTYGAAALALSVLVRWQMLVAMDMRMALAYLVCMHPAARAGAALLMAGLPYVRLDVDAKAKPVAQPMGTGRAVATACVGIAPTLAFALPQPRLAIALCIAIGALLVIHLACRRWFRRRLGGYTGDALGCAEQLGEMAAGIMMLAALRIA